MYLSIDIGGTKTLIAAFSKKGRIVKKCRFLTPKSKTEFLDVLTTSLMPFAKKYNKNINQIVIAIPGLVKNNQILWFGNRSWHNIDLCKCIKNLFNAEVHLLNDADLATIYESSFYPGLSIYLTFSTGIGGGIARNGKLTSASATFEPGHTIYRYYKKHAEWEDIASAAAVGKHYGKQASSIRDKEAHIAIAHRMSLGLVDIIRKYHPDTIIIGGPMSIIFNGIKPHLEAELRIVMPKTKLPTLVKAKKPKESVTRGSFVYANSINTEVNCD